MTPQDEQIHRVALTLDLHLVLPTPWFRHVIVDTKVFDAVISKGTHGSKNWCRKSPVEPGSLSQLDEIKPERLEHSKNASARVEKERTATGYTNSFCGSLRAEFVYSTV
jgi:hypothetical protein